MDSSSFPLLVDYLPFPDSRRVSCLTCVLMDRHNPSSVGSGTCPKLLPGLACKRHPKQIPKSPQLAPFDLDQHQLYSKLFPCHGAPHPIFKEVPHQPVEETHFGHLYLGNWPSVVTH